MGTKELSWWRTSLSVGIQSVLLSLLGLPAVGAGAVEEQPQIGFASGEWGAPEDSNAFDLYLVNADGSDLTKVVEGTSWRWSWSPDGSRIAYFAHADGSAKVMVRVLDDPDPFVLADAGSIDISTTIGWSPDGSRIVFVGTHGGSTDVYVADVAARSAVNVSNDPWENSYPRWSPDGSSIAYEVRAEGEENYRDDIYIVPSLGGTAVNVTNDDQTSPWGSWSPDGSRFVYVRNLNGDNDIYVSDGDGTNPVQLTSSPANDRDPAWSPDGSLIAFSSGLDESIEFTAEWEILIPSRIHVMAPDGSSLRVITDGSNDPANPLQWSITHRHPTWSPDGARIAHTISIQGPGPHARSSTAYVVDPSGGSPTFSLWDSGGSISIRWSPDGARVALSSTGNYGVDARTIMVAAVSNATPVELVGGVGSGFSGWSTYGSHSAFVDGGVVGPGDTIYVAAPDGTNPLDITGSLDDPATASAAWRPQPMGPVGLVDPATGLWRMRDVWGVITTFYYGDPGDVPFMGDWNCDGDDTPGLYRQSDGFVYLRNSNTQGIADIRFFFGNPGDVPLAGDFNGDGCGTVSIYRPSEARFYIINALGEEDGGLGAAEYSFLFGNAGDKPVVGDWDGDGIDEIGLHRESTGLFYWRNTLTTGIADDEILFGDAGDRFVAGDWGTPDGIETPAVYRPSNTTFYFRHTLTQGVADAQFTWPAGEGDWLPVGG